VTETKFIQANGLRFGYLEAGQGPLALCLHGFPDHAASFRPLMEALANAGYRAISPFMRGYAPTAPAPGAHYQSAALARDVIGLIDALGAEKATLIGHDWGAFAAYGAALLAPERVDALVAMAVPYGPGLGRAMVGDPVQQRRSWYMFFFLAPFAEAAFAHEDYAMVDRLWRDWSPKWTPAPEILASVKMTLRSPGVASAALEYYRATLLPDRRDPALASDQARLGLEPIHVRTLYLHGEDDGCIGAAVSGDIDAFFTNNLVHRTLPGLGHFLHLEDPQTVNRLILDFLGERG